MNWISVSKELPETKIAMVGHKREYSEYVLVYREEITNERDEYWEKGYYENNGQW